MSNLKVLVADDEKIIQNGISRVVNWKAMGLELTAIADDGLSAVRLIKQHKPDIVITDIKMPGLNGLQVIEETRDILDPARYIILSGFSEFDFAKKAMNFGVRHYILKPIDKTKLEQAIRTVTEYILQQKDAENRVDHLNWIYQRSLPFIKEQLFRECVSKKLNENDLDYLQDILNTGPDFVRVLMVTADPEPDLELQNGMKDILDNHMEGRGLLTSTLFLKSILLLVQVSGKEIEDEILGEVKMSLLQVIGRGSSCVLSRKGEISEIRELYYDCLEESYSPDLTEKEPDIQNDNLQKIIRYLNENYDNEEISLKWITRNFVFMNTDYLGKLFKKGTGMSFNRYLMNIRVERAKDYLLRYPESKVHECAYKHGFGYNQQYFSRIFKAYTGLTPSEFKNLRMN